jgi:integrase
MVTEKGLVVTEKLNSSTNGEINVTKNNYIIASCRDTHRPVSFITEAEVYSMADQARMMGKAGDRNVLLILIMFQCALRVSECLNICLRDRVKYQNGYILHILGKGNKPRIIALPEKLALRIGNYAGEHGLTVDDKLFNITRFRVLQIVKQCAKAAGMEHRRVYNHLLRHSGAVTRLSKTGNPKSLQVFLGHNDMKMTMRYLSTLQAIDSLNIEGKVEFDR